VTLDLVRELCIASYKIHFIGGSNISDKSFEMKQIKPLKTSVNITKTQQIV